MYMPMCIHRYIMNVCNYRYMSHSLNSLKGNYIGGNIGDYYRGY